jgi:hypothetical protein
MGSKVSAWGLASLVTIFAACAVGCGAAGADAETEEAAFTVDIQKSERLLAEAVSMAEERARADFCETDFSRDAIVAKLREAIAVRNTVFFRTRVVAKKEILAKELAGTLEWQEILGVFDPAKLDETLPRALAAGVTLWDTLGGAAGNRQKIKFRAEGVAVVSTLDDARLEKGEVRWNDEKTTWSYAKGRLKLGSGEVFDVTHGGEFLSLTPPGADFNTFISSESECDA